jgi:predicted enzyme related to lactoylglutathione lyase
VASGGEVVMDAMDVLDAGRMAVLCDPAGAQVSVWQAGAHQGYEVHGEPGTPIWSELMTRDLAAARAFYNSVFGWTAQQQDFDGVPYTIWKRRDHLVGGALEMDDTWPDETTPHWMIYIATADCDATARRCRELGGTVWHAPDDIGPGRCAMLEDPAGAVFSVITLHRPRQDSA